MIEEGNDEKIEESVVSEAKETQVTKSLEHETFELEKEVHNLTEESNEFRESIVKLKSTFEAKET